RRGGSCGLFRFCGWLWRLGFFMARLFGGFGAKFAVGREEPAVHDAKRIVLLRFSLRISHEMLLADFVVGGIARPAQSTISASGRHDGPNRNTESSLIDRDFAQLRPLRHGRKIAIHLPEFRR